MLLWRSVLENPSIEAFNLVHPGKSNNGDTVENILYRRGRLNGIGFAWESLEEQWAEVSRSAVVASHRSGNERAVNVAKRAGALQCGAQPNEDLSAMADALFGASRQTSCSNLFFRLPSFI